MGYQPKTVYNNKLTLEEYTPQSVYDTKLTLEIADEEVLAIIITQPTQGATGVSRTPLFQWSEDGNIPSNRYYQLSYVAIATAETEPNFNEGVKVTRQRTDTVNQEYTPDEPLDPTQWYACLVLAKRLPTQDTYTEDFTGTNGDPLPEPWLTQVLV